MNQFWNSNETIRLLLYTYDEEIDYALLEKVYVRIMKAFVVNAGNY